MNTDGAPSCYLYVAEVNLAGGAFTVWASNEINLLLVKSSVEREAIIYPTAIAVGYSVNV